MEALSRTAMIPERPKGGQSRQNALRGVGAKVRVTAEGRTQLREVNPSGSYLSTSDVRLYFGLGGAAQAAWLEIEWPSGKKQALENVPTGQTLLLDEANASR